MKKYLLLVFIITTKICAAQNVGIGTTLPDVSSQLEISSTNKGVLIPRMNLLQRNAIPNPATGLLLFVIDDNSFYFNAGIPSIPNWQKVLAGNNVWNTNGNAGINPATNFIGTTDDNDIVLKRNNINVGRIGSSNTRIGTNALLTETGFNNTIIGSSAGNNLQNGIANTAIGFNALKLNTSLGNTALGADALSNTTTGTFNVGIGFNAQVPDAAGHNQLSIANAIYGTDITSTATAKIGIGTSTPTSKLNVNGQVTIDQKNFGGYGGLLLKGNVPGNNYPNIAFTVKNNAATPVDEVAAMIQGDLQNNAAGAEAIDLTFLNSNTGLTGLSEKMRIKANGNVGIGLNPSYKLHIGNATNGLRIEGPAITGGTAISIGGLGNIAIDKPGVVGGRLTILENGNTGIGENSPGFLLNFASALGDKISLYGNSGNHYGFGVQGGTLQIHAAAATDDIAFGTGSSASFNERFRFKGNGAMALNGNTGGVGQVLTSNGNASAVTWTKKPYVLNFNQTATAVLGVGAAGVLSTPIIGLDNQSFNLSETSTLVFSVSINGSSPAVTPSYCFVEVKINDFSSTLAIIRGSGTLASLRSTTITQIGAVTLPPGFYTTGVIFGRTDVFAGNSTTDTEGKLIIQVFPN